jgi:hypothetical protein
VKQIRKRLTYANVMSSIAVFLVLGGASALASAKIKNNAVTTAKIKNGAVSGAKINLGSLGTVPSATNATNATNAGNANTVGGMTVSKITYAANSPSAPQVVLNTQGLVVTAACVASSPVVVATASGVPAGVGVEFNSNATSSGGTVENTADDGSGGIFTTGDEFASVRQRGTFVFQRSDGHIVTGIFDVDNSAALHDSFGGGHADCAFGATINAG